MSVNLSKLIPSTIAFISASAAACSTINTVREDHATLLKTQPVTGPGHDPKLHASVTQADDSFTLAVTRDETCEVRVEKVLHRTTTLRRKVESKATLLVEYGIGAAMLVAGALVTVDASNVPMPDDPAQSNPVGRSGAYGIGGGLFALGTAGVVMGLIDSRRARDAMEDGGTFTEPAEDPPREVRCNEGVSPNTAVLLRPSTPATTNPDSIPLGPADEHGRLVVSWSALPSSWLDASGWVRTVVVVANGADLASVPLDRARSLVAEAAWTKTRAGNSAAGYRAFLDHFPESHHDEATAVYRTTRVPELEADFATALSAKEVQRAESIVEEWTALDPENSKLADARVRTTELKIDMLLADADKRLSTANKDRIDELNGAQGDIDQATALSKPDDARIVKRAKRATQVRAQVVTTLIAESRSRAASGDFDGAAGSLDAAAKLQPESKTIDAARSTVERLKQEAEERAERKRRADESRRAAQCETQCKNGWRHLFVDLTKLCLIDAARTYGVDYAENTPGLPHQCAVQALAGCTARCVDGE